MGHPIDMPASKGKMLCMARKSGLFICMVSKALLDVAVRTAVMSGMKQWVLPVPGGPHRKVGIGLQRYSNKIRKIMIMVQSLTWCRNSCSLPSGVMPIAVHASITLSLQVARNATLVGANRLNLRDPWASYHSMRKDMIARMLSTCCDVIHSF